MRCFQLDRNKQYLVFQERKWDISSKNEIQNRIRQLNEGIERDLYTFLLDWFSDSLEMEVQTSGSTGEPKKIKVSKEAMMRSACRTCHFLDLHPNDSLLLSMNLRYIGAKMMLVRALVCGLRVFVQEPSSHPLAQVDMPVDFLSMVPMQLFYTLQEEKERIRLNQARVVIIGGGVVDKVLEEALQDFDCKVYSTYGMTETLSHIAMRCLNGTERSERYFPLPDISLSLSHQNTLVINIPDMGIYSLQTNDVARLYEDGSFQILGRLDHVVNSGGVKIQIEQDEAIWQQILKKNLVLTSVADSILGEALVLLVETEKTDVDSLYSKEQVKKELPRYHFPKYIFPISQIPRLPNGKIDRMTCKDLANTLKNKNG